MVSDSQVHQQSQISVSNFTGSYLEGSNIQDWRLNSKRKENAVEFRKVKS